ncbi:MAG TPA: carboxypeptidase regulatory-like domain-containing protein [Bryobacteraceae bacterium]|nr:carboxypeptidase regulatory-like domain-containing protein [Bryobacteraceae bacterium]
MRLPFLLLLAAAGATPQTTAVAPFRGAPPVQTGNASLEGVVTNAITGEPVKGAMVSLSGIAGLEAATDASGRFAFRRLPAGRYVVQANSPRYPKDPLALEGGWQTQVTLSGDENKTGVGLSLTPGGSVRGHVFDETGNPMANCFVSPMQLRDGGRGRTLQTTGYAQSDDDGEYQLANLAPGRYYLMARCPEAIPLPHALIPRAAARDLPVLAYAPQFYPGVADQAQASRVEVAAGAAIAGADFQVAPATTFSVRGRVSPVPDAPLQIWLDSRESPPPAWQRRGAVVDRATGEFRFPNVPPGSYELFAFSPSPVHPWYGKMPVEVSTTPPEPVRLTLSPAMSIAGTLSLDEDAQTAPQAAPQTPVNSLRVTLVPVDTQGQVGPSPSATVDSDGGSFLLEGVLPGRWRIEIQGPNAYLKSATVGDQELASAEWDISAAPAPLKLVAGTQKARFDGALSALPPDGDTVYALIWGRAGLSDQQQTVPATPLGQVSFQAPPGVYHVCAVSVPQPWILLQNLALRKSLEDLCPTADLTATPVSPSAIPLLSHDQIDRALQKLDP